MSLSKDEIFAANDAKVIKVDVPEWGGDVHLRLMSGTARNEIVQMYNAAGDGEPPNIICEVLVRCLCDADGKALFAIADASRLSEKSSPVLDKLFRAAMKHNGLDEAVDEGN